MLMIPLEKLAYIIVKAREYDAAVPPTDADSGSNPSDDSDRTVLEDAPGNPTRQELAGALDALNDRERIDVLALTWLGRGDYSRADWKDALREARRVHNRRETTYLLETPLLADYLEEGLSQLGYSIEDYEIGRL